MEREELSQEKKAENADTHDLSGNIPQIEFYASDMHPIDKRANL
jgi:hypothetical protein